MKVVYTFLMIIIIVGCTHSNSKSPDDTIAAAELKGSVRIDNIGSDTIVNYTFTNQSEKTITVIGGAKYILLKDNKVVEEGSVPIKDYIDLEVGEDYKDKKIFMNLQPGSYRIQVSWNKTTAFAEFTVK